MPEISAGHLLKSNCYSGLAPTPCKVGAFFRLLDYDLDSVRIPA